MSSNIPSEICDHCCQTCHDALMSIHCMVDYEACLDWACDASSQQGGYTPFQDLAERYTSLRDIADADTELCKHQIYPSLLGASIVNGCMSCFHCLLENVIGDLHLAKSVLLTLPTAFIVDTDTCTPITTANVCDVRDNDQLTNHVHQTCIPVLLVAYFNPVMMSTFVNTCGDLMASIYTNWTHTTRLEGRMKELFFTLTQNWPWQAMYVHKPEALDHLLHCLSLVFGYRPDMSWICEGYLRDMKHKDHKSWRIAYCKAFVSEHVFAEAINELCEMCDLMMSTLSWDEIEIKYWSALKQDLQASI